MKVGDREHDFDQAHYLIPGLKGATSSENEAFEDDETSDDSDSTFVSDTEASFVDDDYDIDGSFDGIPVPTDFVIKSQRVTRQADGTESVDVIVELRDSVPGVKYEFRVAQA